MRKGVKRKISQKEDADVASSSPQENHKPEIRAKKAKTSKPKPLAEPEYFQDKRNLEDLWKAVFPVGTEWDRLDALYENNWDFSNLENAFEEGGVLHGNNVYLFGCTEAPSKDVNEVPLVPIVVAVVSAFPPSDKIGICSVQRGEEIVPMKQMKMDWVPYIPLENRDSQVDRLRSQIFILGCTQRRAALRHLKLDRVKKFEYCLPYFYQPFKQDELEESTEVTIMYPLEPPVLSVFDWAMDELGEFTDSLIEEEELPTEEKDNFKEFVKKEVLKARSANRQASEARKMALEEMSDETKEAFENMRFYKFYPVQRPDAPAMLKTRYINRYYCKAHEIL